MRQPLRILKPDSSIEGTVPTNIPKHPVPQKRRKQNWLQNPTAYPILPGFSAISYPPYSHFLIRTANTAPLSTKEGNSPEPISELTSAIKYRFVPILVGSLRISLGFFLSPYAFRTENACPPIIPNPQPN